MRGPDEQTQHMFSYLSPEQRVPADHPRRAIRALTDEALHSLSPRFASLYATTGRPSIPPEQLLRALLLPVLYTVRSERLLMEELHYNLLFRWFVGLNRDDPIWHPTTFTKNRDRLLAGDVAAAFFDAVRAQARTAGLLSDEHFTVDGTQLEAWASLKSFQRVDAAPGEPPDDPGNPTVNFHGESRRNDTHQSTTDGEAMLHKKGKGKEAKLAYLGHVLLDNRDGLVANVYVTHATGTAEREAAAILLEASAPRQYGRGRHRLRRGEFRGGGPWPGRHPACRPEGPVECDRWPDHAASGLRGEWPETEARRTGLWVDEDRRRPAQAPPSRRRARGLDRHLCGHGV
jgi:transposase